MVAGGNAKLERVATGPKRVRTLFLSDIHLGARGCQAYKLLDFMRHYDADTIYLVGDIGWVESCTAVVEDFGRTFAVVRWTSRDSLEEEQEAAAFPLPLGPAQRLLDVTKPASVNPDRSGDMVEAPSLSQSPPPRAEIHCRMVK